MTTKKFKTNIQCSGCVAKVTPILNTLVGSDSWSVDTANSDKVLTIDNDSVTEESIMEQIQKAGYRIEIINDKK